MVDFSITSAPQDPIVGADVEKLEFHRGKQILHVDFVFVRKSGATTGTRVTNVAITGKDYVAALVAANTPGDPLAEKTMSIEEIFMSRIDAFVSTLSYVNERLTAAIPKP